ncbi:MAG: hypothetical protein GY834_08895 [Bacteroidetes bacterium]|nr:hypothetical protein [Bacteroidota bacterium]
MREKTYRYTPKEPEIIDSLIEGSYVRYIQLTRRNLLIVSFILLFSYLTKVNPEKAAFLGLKFDEFQESHYYIVLIGLLVYFLSAFIVYAYPKYKLALSKKDQISKNATIFTKPVKWYHIELPRLKLDFQYKFWLGFHYYFPVVIAVIALIIGVIKIV